MIESLKYAPDHDRALLLKGTIYARLGKPKMAEVAWEEVKRVTKDIAAYREAVLSLSNLYVDVHAPALKPSDGGKLT